MAGKLVVNGKEMTAQQFEELQAYDRRQQALKLSNQRNIMNYEDQMANRPVDTSMQQMMAMMSANAARSKAQMDANSAINEEMQAAFLGAQKTISGYEGQERRRLFEAKKGTGQVDASDTAIKPEMYKSAKKLLEAGTAGWDKKRADAIAGAGGGGCAMPGSPCNGGAPGGSSGASRAGYLSNGDLDLGTASGSAYQAGRDYQGSGNTSLLGQSVRRAPRR